jgi:hypothetical protein
MSDICPHLCVSLKRRRLQSYGIYLVVKAVIYYLPSLPSSSIYFRFMSKITFHSLSRILC